MSVIDEIRLGPRPNLKQFKQNNCARSETSRAEIEYFRQTYPCGRLETATLVAGRA